MAREGREEKKNKEVLKREKKVMQGKAEDWLGKGICGGHGSMSRHDILQELHEQKIPSPRPSKQASCKNPLGTKSKSEEEPAWDLLLNAPACM